MFWTVLGTNLKFNSPPSQVQSIPQSSALIRSFPGLSAFPGSPVSPSPLKPQAVVQGQRKW